MHFVSGDATLFYAEQGSGPALVLLHGNRESHHHMARIAEELSADYRVILLDSRGHGHSQWGSETLTLDVMVNDVLALLDHLHVPSALLFGFSDGGNLALHVAASAPECVKALVAVSPNVRPDGLKRWFLTALRLQSGVLRVLGKVSGWARQEAAYTDLMLHHSDISASELRAITARVMVIIGGEDLITVDHAREIVQCVADAELTVLPQAHHTSIFREPVRYAQLGADFLRSRSSEHQGR
ncbi:MAG: alpha/beta hydrolase [Cellulomonadaceae bacterium]|jgi:pimeloyl-ACP methyl ester carboxylesterase|nr:alpha/beta hydrolase [Cellulomonadaceae bacterium]